MLLFAKQKRNLSVRPNPCTISTIKFAIYVHSAAYYEWRHIFSPFIRIVHSYRSNYEHINSSLNAHAFKAIHGICAIISERWSASKRLDPVLKTKQHQIGRYQKLISSNQLRKSNVPNELRAIMRYYSITSAINWHWRCANDHSPYNQFWTSTAQKKDLYVIIFFPRIKTTSIFRAHYFHFDFFSSLHFHFESSKKHRSRIAFRVYLSEWNDV